MTTMEGRVSEGGKWLDRHRPGWVGLIDLESLDLESCDRCALGQVFGSAFNTGFGVVMDMARDYYGPNVFEFQGLWAAAHGFGLGLREYHASIVAAQKLDPLWAQLRECWVTEILSRRFAEQHEPAPLKTPVSVEG